MGQQHMRVSEKNVSHLYSKAIPSDLVGRLHRNRRKEKAERRAKISKGEEAIAEAIAEANILLDFYKGGI
jgi:hypothetical protein